MLLLLCHSPLVSLNLSENRLGHQLRCKKWRLDAAGIALMSKMVERNTKLMEFDISDNNLGYESSRLIGKAIFNNSALLKIDVSNNGLPIRLSSTLALRCADRGARLADRGKKTTGSTW
jgi:hypothetical protein